MRRFCGRGPSASLSTHNAIRQRRYRARAVSEEHLLAGGMRGCEDCREAGQISEAARVPVAHLIDSNVIRWARPNIEPSTGRCREPRGVVDKIVDNPLSFVPVEPLHVALEWLFLGEGGGLRILAAEITLADKTDRYLDRRSTYRAWIHCRRWNSRGAEICASFFVARARQRGDLGAASASRDGLGGGA